MGELLEDVANGTTAHGNEKDNEKDNEDITLSDYMKAGYSFIHVRTTEDERAQSHIKSEVRSVPDMDDVLYLEWTCTSGLREISEDGTEHPVGAQQLPDALDNVLTNVEPRVVVLYNVRQFMHMPVIVQKFKDASRYANMIGSHIILVGPHFDVPVEIANDITVYDLDLPSVEDFTDDFSFMASRYKDSIKDYVESDIKQAASSAIGMTKLQGENAIALSLTKRKEISPVLIQKEKEAIVKRSDVLEFIKVDEDMDTLGGFNEFKEWIEKRKDAFSQEAIDFGIKTMKGVLLTGTPGTGKTLCSKALAHYLKVPLLRFDLGKVFRGVQGGSESAIREALKTAEAVAPVVALIDEVEKATAGSQSSGQTDSGTTARVMGTILSWMQDTDKPVFICATANNPDRLPAEFMRKGRFSEIWGVIEPNEEEREKIWEIHTKKIRPDSTFDCKKLAEQSEGYVGAEIEAMVGDALITAFSDGKRELRQEDLETSIGTMVPQTKTNAEQISKLKEWMEGKVRYVSGVPVCNRGKGIDAVWSESRKERSLRV